MNKSFETLKVNLDNGILRVDLNRAEVHNAFNPTVIEELTSGFVEAESDPSIRIVVLGGKGKSFSAGADLDWMRSTRELDEAENIEDALRMAEMFASIFRCEKPTIARVHGAARGGGIGLVAACDMALASERASFAWTEVRLGITPAVISPYVIYKIGAAAAHRFFLTGERFDAEEARRIGLVSSVHAEDELDEAVAEVTTEILKGAPGAQTETKRLIAHVSGFSPEDVQRHTAELIARLRSGDEGKRGIASFLENKTPSWVPDELGEE